MGTPIRQRFTFLYVPFPPDCLWLSVMTPAAATKDQLSGFPGHLNQEQEAILHVFKEQLRAEGYYDPEVHDDATLLRFLRARKYDVAKSKAMWIDTQKWRKDYNVDKLYPRFYHKTDKDGRPVYIEQLGKLDLTKLYEVTTPERQLQSHVVEYEKFLRDRLPVCSAIAGRLIETSCTIMDLKGVGISQFWKVKNYVQEASSISQNNYPETMGKFYIINAPWAFSTVWSLVKGWLDEATVAKIHILGSDYKKSLLEQIPEDSLPAFLGGSHECSQGCSMSDAGPWNGKKVLKREGRLYVVDAKAADDVLADVASDKLEASTGKEAVDSGVAIVPTQM